MSPHVPAASGQRLSPRGDTILVVLAVTLMIGGVVMLFTDVSAGIAIPLIAVGIALTAAVHVDKKRPREG